MPVSFSNNITAVFKTGGKFTRTTRNNDYDRYFSDAGRDATYANVGTFFGTDPSQVRSGNNRLRLTDIMDNNFDRGKNFLSDEYDFKHGFEHVINTDIYDRWLLQSMTGWTPAMKMDDSWRRDFRGSEAFTAAYLMTTLNISQRLTLLGGVRYEQYNMNYHANFTYVLHDVYGNANSTAVGTIEDLPYDLYNVDRTDKDWFPNAQLKYNVTDWMDIRVAYTTGISRPDYFSIVPRTTIFPGASIEVGNPKLRPTTGQNIDVIASFYNNMIGLFTVNGFYKKLEDVQYAASIYYGNLAVWGENNLSVPDSAFLVNKFGSNATPKPNHLINTYYNNPNPGHVKGVEFDWQTNFWYLPAPFNSLVFNINYTKSWSDMDYRIIRNDPVKVYDPVTRKTKTYYVTTDTVFSGKLIQQAGDVINAAIGIDYKGFSGRLSFNMRGDVINNVGSRPEEASYTGNIYRWDFSLKQNLPLEGLSVSLNGVNIFHNSVKTYRKYRMNASAPITENLISVLYSPTIFQLNVRYSF